METKFGHPVQIAEVKAAEDGSFEVSGYAATFGNVDLGGDVILPGAFKDSLAADNKHVPFLFSHRPDLILGKALSLKEDDKGLFARFKISKTQLGQDTHTLLKDGALNAFSIGYVTKDAEFTDNGEVRKLKQLDLYEVSAVAMPMNPEALVTAVKSAEAIEEVKDTWTAAYVNDLPDSAFAVVLDGGSKDGSGKTVPRDLRKLPHHDTSGAVDLPHLRNALAREPQTQMSAADHATAHAHLQRHADAAGIGSGGKADDDLPSLSDLPLSEHAEIIEAEFATFVARAQDALSGLSDKGHDLSRAKRLAFEELLERCSGLETVRSDLAKALAAAGPPKDRAISLNPVKRRLESTRRRLLAEGILPPADDAAA